MQDRYVGDIGDFGKYALLRAHVQGDLKLGVHWYRNADEESNADGKFTQYAHLRSCDPDVFDELQRIVALGRRSIPTVESSEVLPRGTVFYSHALSYSQAPDRDARLDLRREWNRRALEALASVDVVFMDPDNGFSCQTAHPAATKGAKYVFVEELKPYCQRSQSLIVYHHQTREKGGLSVTLPLKFEMLRSLGFQYAWALVFRRVSVRVYFVLPAPQHASLLWRRSTQFRESPWGKEGHFQVVAPPSTQIETLSSFA